MMICVLKTDISFIFFFVFDYNEIININIKKCKSSHNFRIIADIVYPIFFVRRIFAFTVSSHVCFCPILPIFFLYT